MSEIRDIASNFEAVKIAMTQDKNGHVLKLSIHPNDTPEDIMRDPVGTRYMVAIVRTNDQGEPVASQQTDEGIRAVKLAGALCGDVEFQNWLVYKGLADEVSEDAAADAMRRMLGITSRKELRVNADARQKLLAMRQRFGDYMRNGV